MRPNVSLALADLARLLTTEIAPILPRGPVAGELGMWALSLNVLAERWDGHVADLVEENARFQDLVERSAGIVSSPLRDRLTALAKASAGGLRVSQLEDRRAALLRGLQDVQVELEETDSPSATMLGDAIWRELSASAKKRHFSGSPF